MKTEGQYKFAIIALLCLPWLILQQGFSQDKIDVNTSNVDLYNLILEARKKGDDPLLAEAYHRLAENDLFTIDNADRAITNYLNSIDIYKKLGDSINFHEIKLDLGRLYAGEAYYNEALVHFEEALRFYIHEGDSIMMARVLTQMGDAYLASEDIPRAVEYLERARELNLKTQDTLLAMITKMTLSSITKSGEGQASFADSSLTEFEEGQAENVNYRSSTLLNVGLFNLQRKKFALALYYLHKSEEAAKQDEAQLREVYRYLSDGYQQMGDYPLAYQYLQKYSIVNDKLLNERRQRIINSLMIRHQSFEKEAEILDLQKDNYIAMVSGRLQKILTFGLLLGFLIVLFGTYLVIRNYQQRLNTNQIIAQQNEEINKQKINELENNLKIETMHSMIGGQEVERERIAKDLHDSLGGLLSTVKLHFDAVQTRDPKIGDLNEYQRANLLLDEACKEVRNISNNMQPGALLKLGIVPAINDLIIRAQGKSQPNIDFQHYGMDNKLDNSLALNIFRIVQELMNNSLKHVQADEILVQLIQKDNEIILMVEDDGIGYDEPSVTKGMGTENIASRVNFLKGDISIHSVKGTGTTTLINIPLS